MYNVIVSTQGQFPMTLIISSVNNLVSEYKDAVISQKKFLTWEKGCIEMTNVLGVYEQ